MRACSWLRASWETIPILMRKTAKEKARTLKNTLDFVFLGVGFVCSFSFTQCMSCVSLCLCERHSTGQTVQQRKDENKRTISKLIYAQIKVNVIDCPWLWEIPSTLGSRIQGVASTSTFFSPLFYNYFLNILNHFFYYLKRKIILFVWI